MASAQMNTILRDLGRIAHALDFDRHDLGEDLLDLTADAIRRQMDDELDPDGNRWDELSDEYAEWKARHYPGKPMAVLAGLMKSRPELEGQRHIVQAEARMVYGITDEAKALAEWFQEGNDHGRPARPFYYFDDTAIQLADDRLNRALIAACP